MLQHRGFPTTTTDRTICALSLAPSRAPYRARARARLHEVGPTSTARRPARSERPAHSPFAATQPRPSRSALPRSVGPERVKRWRRGHIHFSPERARAVRRAPARPEWSVASDAEGGSGERGGPLHTHLSSRLRRSVRHILSWRTQKGRGRLGRPPTPQAPQGPGAQRRSRDVERPRAFVSVTSRSQY
jgi:hypothetical protein